MAKVDEVVRNLSSDPLLSRATDDPAKRSRISCKDAFEGRPAFDHHPCGLVSYIRMLDGLLYCAKLIWMTFDVCVEKLLLVGISESV